MRHMATDRLYVPVMGLWMLATAAGAQTSAAAPPTDPVLGTLRPYAVVQGDTLISVRDRLLVPDASWQALQKLNKVKDPRRLVPGSTLLLPDAWFKDQPATAEVLHAFGDVTVVRATGASEKLIGGMTLAGSDVIKTGAQSSATLRFADGARLVVRPNAEATLTRMTKSMAAQRAVAQTEIGLQRGAVEASVPPTSDETVLRHRKFDIRTPVANLGVRGTTFRSEADGAEQRVEVLTGLVATTAGGNQAGVSAGFGAIATKQGVQVKPLLSAPDVSGMPTLIERLPLAVQVPVVNGAVGYVAQLSRTDAPEALLAEERDAGNRVRFAQDIADGNYTVRMRGIDASNLEGKDATLTITLNAKPEAPFLQQPAPLAVLYDEQVSFSWTRQPQAQTYHLQVADDAAFKNIRHDQKDLTDTKAALTLPVGTHYWRLAAVQSGGTAQDHGPFGDAQQLTRKAPPPAPPPAQSSVSSDGLAMRWPASTEAGARYAYQFARDANFSQVVAQGETAKPEFATQPPGAGTYYFRVRTLTADGYAGPWGSAQSIELPDNRWWWLLLPAALLLL
jgi:hypothetical protein